MTQQSLCHSAVTELIAHIFRRIPAAFIIILGRRGTGKTSLALWIMEILHDYGIIEHFATNVDIDNPPFPIETITNLEDLRFWAKNTPGKKMFVFDEIGKALRRRTPMASLSVKLIDEFQIMRKYKLSTVATTINEEYIDKAVLGSDILDGFFEKRNWKNPKIASYDDYLEIFHKDLTNIPDTSLKFDTWSSGPFQEKSPTRKPMFKEKDLELLWDLTHGKTMKDLGLHEQQVARLWRKFVKEVLEREHHTSQSLERADTIEPTNVIEPQN